MKLQLNEQDIERILIALQILRCCSRSKKLQDLTSQQLTVTYNKVRRQLLREYKQK